MRGKSRFIGEGKLLPEKPYYDDGERSSISSKLLPEKPYYDDGEIPYYGASKPYLMRSKRRRTLRMK